MENNIKRDYSLTGSETTEAIAMGLAGACVEPAANDNWKGETSYIHNFLFNSYLKNHHQPAENEYYLCGPPMLIEAGLKILKTFGVDDKLVAFDEF